MTKKHFIALADTMKYQKPCQIAKPKGYADRLETWQNIINGLADFCASQNPNFNRERWMDYIDGKCGSNGGKVKKAVVHAL